MVTIKNTKTLTILGQDYPITDVGDPYFDLMIVFDGQVVSTGEFEHHCDAMENLVKRVEFNLKPIHEAELQKLEAWNSGKPIVDKTGFVETSWTNWPGVVR
jgi:hypothetical protein